LGIRADFADFIGALDGGSNRSRNIDVVAFAYAISP
jgi:hypothetical protein